MSHHYRFWKTEGEYRYCRPGHDFYLVYDGTLYLEYVGQVGEIQQYISTTNEFAELAYESSDKSWEYPHDFTQDEVITINGIKAKVLYTYNSADGAIEVITNLRTSVVDSVKSIESKVKALAAVERHKQEVQEKHPFSTSAVGMIIPTRRQEKKRWWRR